MDLLTSLLRAEQAADHAQDLQGRATYPVLCTVTNNDDPQGRRRIRCTVPAAPSLETTWLRRLETLPGFDPPLPTVGQTVLVLFVDGLETNGWYVSAVNATNPPEAKQSAQDDLYLTVPQGRLQLTVGAAQVTIENDGQVVVQNGGATITVSAVGAVTVTAGAAITLDAGSTLTLRADTVAFDTSSATLGGNQIATVGALDSRGDTLTTKGWA